MLVTACELGLFDVLRRHSLPLDALAERLECEPKGLQLLLQLLNVNGQQAKLLVDVVMQLAGDSGAFFFLGAD